MRTFFGRVAVVALLAGIGLTAHAQGADTALATRAIGAIRLYPHFSIFDDVTVDARDGVITLTGCVTMPYKRDEIGARVGRVDGVRSVANEIHVLPVSPVDAKLRTRIADAIYGHPSFWRYAAMANPPIHIIVANSRVTLTGVVSTEVDRTLAFTLAHVPGALDVTNKLRLEKEGAGRVDPP
jgi:osmotically-inducible protein OsmY